MSMNGSIAETTDTAARSGHLVTGRAFKAIDPE